MPTTVSCVYTDSNLELCYHYVIILTYSLTFSVVTFLFIFMFVFKLKWHDFEENSEHMSLRLQHKAGGMSSMLNAKGKEIL